MSTTDDVRQSRPSSTGQLLRSHSDHGDGVAYLDVYAMMSAIVSEQAGCRNEKRQSTSMSLESLEGEHYHACRPAATAAEHLMPHSQRRYAAALCLHTAKLLQAQSTTSSHTCFISRQLLLRCQCNANVPSLPPDDAVRCARSRA